MNRLPAEQRLNLLTDDEVHLTFASPMLRVGADEEPPVDFWPYFDAIPNSEFQGHDCGEGSVTYAYRDSNARYEHVLIDTEDRNVFMVLVLDIANSSVFGHHLLDLNEKYGLGPNGALPLEE